jgi:Tfp pilus assembly protein PilX
MKKKFKLNSGIHGKRGMALVYAVIILLVITILTASVFAMFTSNLRQEEYQKNYIEAYYLAYSGIQMAFSAIIAEDSSGNPNDLFNKLKDGIIAECNQNNISYGNGVIDIHVDVVDDPASAYDNFIKIRSTGTLSAGGITVTRILYVDPLDQQNVIWANG